jgi:hypothetical protein
LVNCIPVPWAAKTDYAICAGDVNIHAKPGPKSTSPEDVASYPWPAFMEMGGVSFIRSRVSLGQVSDGLSQTILIGEKHLASNHYHNGMSRGDDQTMYLGDDADIRRWTSAPPVSDKIQADDIEHFGGPHVSVCNVVLCDGSVQGISFSISAPIFAGMGNRADGR